MMNPQHLTSQELSIESEIRNIQGSVLDQIKSLQARLIEESNDSPLAPKKPHKKAATRPRDEIRVCCKILHEVRQEYDDIPEETEGDKDLRDRLISRILHVRGRVERISGSKVVSNDAKKLVTGCDEILKIVINVENLDESRRQMNDIDMVIDFSSERGSKHENHGSKTKKKLSEKYGVGVAGSSKSSKQFGQSKTLKVPKINLSDDTSESSTDNSQSVKEKLTSTMKLKKMKRRNFALEGNASDRRLLKAVKKIGLSTSKLKASRVGGDTSSSSTDDGSSELSSSSSSEDFVDQRRRILNRGHRENNAERRPFD